MPDNEIRLREDEYFRKKDQELIEKMRRAAAAEAARRELGIKAGVSPEMVHELEALGFTIDTVILVAFVPLVQVAWAEGGVSSAERDLIVKFARARGVAEGSAADKQLSAWLTTSPGQEMFTRAARLIGAFLDSPAAAATTLTADDLVEYCERIATASGGIFGLNKVSSEERAVLSQLAGDLKGRQKS